jgi:purine-binding chemotaxis protein CheW
MKKQITILKTGRDERDILKHRAALLAEKKITKADDPTFITVVAFQLAGELYGIEVRHIRMVYGVKDLTHIPGVPDFISGIINMRGEIISVVDLKKLLDLSIQKAFDQGQVIILNSFDMELGIGVDKVLGVMRIPENDIQPKLPTLTGIRALYLKGVARDGLVILDGEKILTDKHMIIHIESEIGDS